MTKGQLIESIRGYLIADEPSQDSNGKFNFKRIEIACEQMFGTMLTYMITEDIKGIEDNYVKDYRNQTIVRADGLFYLTLPDKIVALPNGRGIWYVKPQGSRYALPPGGSHHSSMLSSLPIGEIVNNSVWSIGNSGSSTSRKIIIEHLGDSIYANVTRWDFGLVRAFSSYGEGDDIYIPNGRYDYFIEGVFKFFGKRYQDKSNNNK